MSLCSQPGRPTAPSSAPLVGAAPSAVPRVPNARVVPVCTQIAGMRDRLGFWCGDVKSMEMLVEHQAHDILT